MRYTYFAAVLVLASALGATGCDDTDSDEPVEETLEEHLCEHFDDGPFQEQVATGTEADAPLVAVEHTPIRLTLIEADGMYTGFGEFSVENAGSVVVAVGDDIPAVVTNGAGEIQGVVDQPTLTGVCTTLARMDMYDLPVGHYAIELGPSTSEQVVVLVGFPEE